MAQTTSKGKTVEKELPPGPNGPKVEVPKTNVPGAETPAGEKKAKVLIEGITRGRMPIAVVFIVRFGDQKGLATKELATLFGTTVGKITDIKNNATFGYLTADFKPSQQQKEDGLAWLKRHIAYETGAVDVLINELEGMKVGTAEEIAKFESTRVANRGQKATKADGTVAEAGGGNRVKPAKKAEPAAAGEKVKASDLLK